MFAKKSLGQNFLKSKAALRAMIDAAKIDSASGAQETILEIGPGKGALTEFLLEQNAHVVAIEKDDRLIEFLQEKFKNKIASEQLQISHEDALAFDPSALINPSKNGGAYKIVANIPYYITGQFFKHYLTNTNQPKSIVVMVQKEVAHRIVAQDKKESLLSLSVKCYGVPRSVMTVQKKYFSPAPKVDSAIIAIENISRNFFNDTQNKISEDHFFELIKSGFAHKRKVLISNLETIAPREKLQLIFKKLNIPEKIRAEDLTLTNWQEMVLETSQLAK